MELILILEHSWNLPSHQNKILHWCRNVWVYHVLNFVNANSSQILKGPKPGTPHVINVHGFTLNKIYQKQKQIRRVPRPLAAKDIGKKSKFDGAKSGCKNKFF